VRYARLLKIADEKFDHLLLVKIQPSRGWSGNGRISFMNATFPVLKSELLETGAWERNGPPFWLNEKIEIVRLAPSRARAAAIRISLFGQRFREAAAC